jgi:hypothetical protein
MNIRIIKIVKKGSCEFVMLTFSCYVLKTIKRR